MISPLRGSLEYASIAARFPYSTRKALRSAQSSAKCELRFSLARTCLLLKNIRRGCPSPRRPYIAGIYSDGGCAATLGPSCAVSTAPADSVRGPDSPSSPDWHTLTLPAHQLFALCK